jgi:predicted metal-binding protein
VNPEHCLFVCTTCGSKWEDGRRIGTSEGERLLAKLEQLHQDWELAAEFPVRAVGCMSACSRSCAISFAAAGKHTYLFGDIAIPLPGGSANDDLNAPVSNILDCAKKYYQHPAGLLPWAERPAPLKQGIIAKIPPLTITPEPIHAA